MIEVRDEILAQRSPASHGYIERQVQAFRVGRVGRGENIASRLGLRERSVQQRSK